MKWATFELQNHGSHTQENLELSFPHKLTTINSQVMQSEFNLSIWNVPEIKLVNTQSTLLKCSNLHHLNLLSLQFLHVITWF